MKKVLLYSGGMDSWLIDKLYKPDIKLFVDIGTPSAKAERKKLPKDVIVVDFQNLAQFERKEDFILPLRNLYLIALATNYGDEICLGANATDATLDKTTEFAEKLSDLLTYMYGEQKWTHERHIKVNVDYRNFTKAQLLDAYLEQGGSVTEAYFKTFSCFTPDEDGTECHNCRACFLKFMAFVDNGFWLPNEIASTYLPYMKRVVNNPHSFSDRLYRKEDYLKVIEHYENNFR